MKKPEIIVIVGPTATGKSDLAVEIALQQNGEVISADSRQVYKGLDIATGKITKKEMRGVKHHMLDVISPKKVFSVADFIKLARSIIENIVKRDKTPIICGGTGLYVSALLGEMPIPEIPPNETLRKKLAGKSAEELFKIIKNLDPKRAKTIDPKNPVRLIRAIEIAKASKNKDLRFKNQEQKLLKEEFKITKIGLDFKDDILRKRIHDRLLSRMKSGMVREAKKLHSEGLSFKRMRELGLEYRYLADLLQNKLTKEEFLGKLETEIWHYAKRQRTWFKRDKDIKWRK